MVNKRTLSGGRERGSMVYISDTFFSDRREDCGRNCNLDRQIKVLKFARIGSRIVTKGLRPLSVD